MSCQNDPRSATADLQFGGLGSISKFDLDDVVVAPMAAGRCAEPSSTRFALAGLGAIALVGRRYAGKLP